MPELYRKRLIPSECIHLKNDTIVSISDGHIITRWKTLHPKEEFSYGISYYVVKHGWKISKFYKENGTLAYIYCDIIDTSYDKNTDTYIFTDLLADVIIENDGFVRVVDLDELADACRMSIIIGRARLCFGRPKPPCFAHRKEDFSRWSQFLRHHASFSRRLWLPLCGCVPLRP